MTIRILQGDCRSMLALLPDASVHCVVTSPPYYGLRDYGTGQWEGGDPDCSHGGNVIGGPKQTPGVGANGHSSAADKLSRRICALCGATKTDQQIGLEETPAEYVAALVAVFREVWRVLRDDGIAWLNLGDSYAANRPYQAIDNKHKFVGNDLSARVPEGLKPKDLIGIPWRVALALQQPWYAGRIKSEADRLWLAAMIDTEGCMFIHRRKAGQSAYNPYTRKDGTISDYVRTQDSFGLGLEIANTSVRLVERCREITGLGSINSQSPEQNPRRKQMIYRWHVRGDECRDLIREVYPHLVAKQHQARIMVGCPPSGDKAAAAHAAIIALHNGDPTDVDDNVPASMFEPGWYLRSDCIWNKPNPMPESITDRPTSSHEHVFLLAKSGSATFWTHRERAGTRAQPAPDYRWVHRETGEEIAVDPGDDKRWRRVNLWRGNDYFFDADAVREAWTSGRDDMRHHGVRTGAAYIQQGASRSNSVVGKRAAERNQHDYRGGRNLRNVWTIATAPFAEAHFATFPPELAELCIKAGTSERGCCPSCAAPWVRIITKGEPDAAHQRACGADASGGYNGQSTKNHAAAGVQDASAVKARILAGLRERSYAWHPSCSCDAGDPVPCTVLDPFAGAFTAPLVADRLQRHAIGIELNRAYCEMAKRRIERDAGLFADLAAD